VARSERFTALQELIRATPDGGFVTYASIAETTGVEMNTAGKQLLRKVLRSMKREWTCEAGKGIELASARTSLRIVQGKVRGSILHVNRAAVAHNNMEHFYLELSAEDRRYAQMIGVAVGTWIAVGEQMQERLLERTTQENLMTVMKANKERQG
jgi:hypothetical protein